MKGRSAAIPSKRLLAGRGLALARGSRMGPRSSVLDVVDVQLVEVLRAPQGTRLGKNTVGGAVNVTTVKPSMDPEAFVLLRPGSLGTLVAGKGQSACPTTPAPRREVLKLRAYPRTAGGGAP